MSAALAVPAPSASRLVDAFLDGRNARTLRAYSQDLADFRLFVDAPTASGAAERLLGCGPGEANAVALAYRAHMTSRSLAAATINRRLAALRSLVRLGRTLGVVAFELEVQNVKAHPYRDTRGPGRAGFLAILGHLRGRADAKALRDTAIIRCLYERGLRCCEVVGLDVADVDVERCAVAVVGKGRTTRESLTVAPATMAAVQLWLEVRPTVDGPLFVSLDRAHVPARLSTTSIYNLVRKLGDAVGIRARPHGLRHAAITSALDAGADVRAVQRFSRHRDLRVLMLYDDSRRDFGGEVARTIAEPA